MSIELFVSVASFESVGLFVPFRSFCVCWIILSIGSFVSLGSFVSWIICVNWVICPVLYYWSHGSFVPVW